MDPRAYFAFLRNSSGGRKHRGLAITVGSELLFLVLLYWPLFFPLHHHGVIDSDMFLAWQLAVNDALAHGELLHWTHHFCGGMPGLAEPQSGALSPFNLLGLIVDPIVQMKINVFAHFAVCSAGFVLLTRRMGVPDWYGIAGFVIWAGNGMIAFRLLHGQETFYPLLYLPFMLALIWPYLADATTHAAWRRDFVLGTILVSLMILEDGFQILIYAGVFLGIAAVTRAAVYRDVRALKLLGAWYAAALLLCAIRLVPMIELLADHPRLVSADDFLTPGMLANSFLSPRQFDLYHGPRPAPPHNVWAAYGAFTGWAPILLFVYGIWFLRKRPFVVALVPATLVCAVIMLGHFSDWSPWALVRALPLMDMVRAPHRFSSMVIFSFAVVAVAAQTDLVRRLRLTTGWTRAMLVLLVIGIAVPEIHALRPLLAWGFRAYQPAHARIDDRNGLVHRMVHRRRMFTAVASNVGIHNCVRALDLPNATIPNFPLAVPGAKTTNVRSKAIPNAVMLEVDAARADVIVVNENFHHDWTVTTGRADGPFRFGQGLLALRVPAGRQSIELRYVPRAFRLGAAMSLLSLLVGYLLVRWTLLNTSRLRRRTAAASSATSSPDEVYHVGMSPRGSPSRVRSPMR